MAETLRQQNVSTVTLFALLSRHSDRDVITRRLYSHVHFSSIIGTEARRHSSAVLSARLRRGMVV